MIQCVTMFGGRSINYLMLAVCLAFVASQNAVAVVFGNKDDRTNISQITDADVIEMTKAVAVMADSKHLSFTDKGIFLKGPELQAYGNLCPDQQFIGEPVMGSCTGFLISDELLLTAGHCQDTQLDCQLNGWVFDFTDTRLPQQMEFSSTDDVFIPVPSKNFAKCDHVVARSNNNLGDQRTDFSIIRLKQPMTDRPHLEMDIEKPVVDTSIFALGFPTGLPMKYTGGATILNVKPGFFESDLDVFSGNSGSPVVNTETNKVVGILVRGNRDLSTNDVDYAKNKTKNCYEVRKVKECGTEACSWAASTLSSVTMDEIKKAMAQIDAQKHLTPIDFKTTTLNLEELWKLSKSKGAGRCFIEEWAGAADCDYTLRIVSKTKEPDQTKCFASSKQGPMASIDDNLIEPSYSSRELSAIALQEAIRLGKCNL